MTAVIEEQAVAAPAESPAGAEVKPLTRRTAIAAVEAAFAVFAEQMILARRLTLDTSNVRSQGLCGPGTKGFMTKGHLQPPSRDTHPANERPEETAESETRIRTWVRTHMPGALEDYTATGLMKQVPVIEAARKKWHADFRELIIRNFKDGYIQEERMQEVLPQLGMPLYEVVKYVSMSVSADWHAPASNFGGTSLSHQQMNELLREKIQKALQEIAGEGHSTLQCSYGINSSRHVRVSVENWRG